MTGLGNALRQLLRDLRAQKLRTFLTTLGIVWGTVAVSLLLAFGGAFHRQMQKNAAGLGRGIVIAWPSQTSIPFEGLGKGRRIRVTAEDLDLVRKRAQLVGAVSAEFQDTLTLQLGPRRLAVEVSGVDPPYGEMRNLIPQAGGRFLNPLDSETKRRVAFLGNELAEQLFGATDPVGQIFRLHGSPFTVVGVLKRKVQQSSYSGRDKDKVVIPASTFRALTGEKYVSNFIFTAAALGRSEAAADEVLAILAARHRFDPRDEEALSIWDTTEMARFLDTFMNAFKAFLAIVGSLTLVVGGIGVSNIMNVVVEERTSEIGVKMALGAKPRGILGQFLVETLIVTAVGGAIGLAITAAICAGFPALGLTDFVGRPEVSTPVAAITASLLGLIGLVAGYFPAKTAADLDPVVAMKM
ncbi:MAG: ABC transporter permease [Thermoanaerobaculia bacterium]|nr:ABC transporter permease [Thermoanaerobaculia bacterium]